MLKRGLLFWSSDVITYELSLEIMFLSEILNTVSNRFKMFELGPDGFHQLMFEMSPVVSSPWAKHTLFQ